MRICSRTPRPLCFFGKRPWGHLGPDEEDGPLPPLIRRRQRIFLSVSNRHRDFWYMYIHGRRGVAMLNIKFHIEKNYICEICISKKYCYFPRLMCYCKFNWVHTPPPPPLSPCPPPHPSPIHASTAVPVHRLSDVGSPKTDWSWMTMVCWLLLIVFAGSVFSPDGDDPPGQRSINQAGSPPSLPDLWQIFLTREAREMRPQFLPKMTNLEADS